MSARRDNTRRTGLLPHGSNLVSTADRPTGGCRCHLQSTDQRSYGGLNDDRQRSYGGLNDADAANYQLKKIFGAVWGTPSKN
jgi:hypothetical protein